MTRRKLSDTHENFRAYRNNAKLHGRTQIPEPCRVSELVHHPVGIVRRRHFQHNLEKTKQMFHSQRLKIVYTA